MTLAASRDKLRVLVGMQDTASSSSHFPATRLLPGGEIVAVEERRRSTPFRREASALRPEKGNSKTILEEFERERLRTGTPALDATRSTFHTDATGPISSPGIPPRSASSAALMSGRWSPLMGIDGAQSGVIERGAGNWHSWSQYSLADAPGLRITKRRPQTSGNVQLMPPTTAAHQGNKGHTALGVEVPSNRSEAIRLNRLLDTLLEVEAGGWEEQCNAYDSTFAEATLQVANHCVERGELLQRIRKFYRLVVRAERDAREIARKAREDAHDARARESDATQRMQQLERVVPRTDYDGHGIEGTVDGHRLRLGQPAWLHGGGEPASPAACSAQPAYQACARRP